MNTTERAWQARAKDRSDQSRRPDLHDGGQAGNLLDQQRRRDDAELIESRGIQHPAAFEGRIQLLAEERSATVHRFGLGLRQKLLERVKQGEVLFGRFKIQV